MGDGAFADNVFAKRFNPLRSPRPSVDLLDLALFLPGIWVASALSLALRLIGPLFLVVPVGFCLVYAILRLAAPPRLLSVYFAYCVLVAALSRFQLFPPSWQLYFRADAIVRQLIPLLAYVAVAWASTAYFQRRILAGNPFFGAPVTLVLCFLVAPVVMFLEGFAYPGEDAAHAMISLMGSLINNVLVGTFFVMGAIFLTSDWRRYAALAGLLAIAVTSHFIQAKIILVVVLAILVGLPSRAVAIASVAAMTAIYVIGLGFVDDAMRSSPNSGIRLAFLRDALISVGDTFGLGVGYGKESVRWQYQFPGMPVFTFLPDPKTITPERMLEAMSTGVENSFVESLLRAGVLGFGLFVTAFFAAFPPRNLPPSIRNHAASVFATMFLGCFVNSALESPLSAVGHAYLYGYMVALRVCARARPQAFIAAPVRLATDATPSPAQADRPPAGSPA